MIWKPFTKDATIAKFDIVRIELFRESVGSFLRENLRKNSFSSMSQSSVPNSISVTFAEYAV